MLHTNAAEEEGDDPYIESAIVFRPRGRYKPTGHVDGVGEEVACVRNQNDETTLRFRKSPEVGEFQKERRDHSNDESNNHAAEEHTQEGSSALNQTEDFDIRAGLFIFLGGFEKDDCNSIVQYSFAEDHRVQFRIHFVCIENGQDGDGIRGRESGSDGHGVNEVDIDAI